MGYTFLTYRRDVVATTRQMGACCLCSAHAQLGVKRRHVQVKLNGFIPWGTYAETIVHCSACGMAYLATDSLSHALVPSRNARRLTWLAWGCLPLPVLNLILQGLALSQLPRTSNRYRQWAKVGLIPAALITGLVIFAAVAATTIG